MAARFESALAEAHAVAKVASSELRRNTGAVLAGQSLSELLSPDAAPMRWFLLPAEAVQMHKGVLPSARAPSVLPAFAPADAAARAARPTPTPKLAAGGGVAGGVAGGGEGSRNGGTSVTGAGSNGDLLTTNGGKRRRRRPRRQWTTP